MTEYGVIFFFFFPRVQTKIITLFTIPRCWFVWQIHPGCTLSFIVYWTAKIHPFGTRGIKNSWVIKPKVGKVKGASCRHRGRQQNAAMHWRNSLILSDKSESWALVRYLVVDEDPEGTEHVWVIPSDALASTQTHQSGLETKARSVLFLCRVMSLRNSPLIRFILFYEAGTPNSVEWEVLFLRVPPRGAPCLFSLYQSCCGATCVLDYNSMHIHWNVSI